MQYKVSTAAARLTALLITIIIFTLTAAAQQQLTRPDPLRAQFLANPQQDQQRQQKPQPVPQAPKSILFVADPPPPHGFFKPYGPAFWTSTGGFIAGSAFDILTTTSRGLYERNGFFRNSEGHLNVGKNVGVTALVYAATLPFERRHPKLMFAVRNLIGGLRFGRGIANLGQHP